MKKTPQQFESLKDAKFRTLESKELEAVSGGMPVQTLDTITVTPTGSSNDGNDGTAGEK